MSYKYLIIDAQNLYWRAVMASLKKCLDSDNRQIYANSIKNFLDRVNDFEKNYGEKNCEVYLLFDNPLSVINKRKSIDVEYKHTREDKNVPKNFYKTLDILLEIIKVYKKNLYIVKWDGLEADDLVYPIVQHINKEKNEDKKLVISADMDWARAIGVDNNIEWYNFVEIYNIKIFKDKYGFEPIGKKIQMYKAIHGDNSDAIPNAVPYLPKDILIDIIEHYDDVDKLLTEMWEYKGIPNQWAQKIKEAEKRIKINFRLADYVVYKNIPNYIYTCKEDLKMLRFWFSMHDIEFENKMYEDNQALFFQGKREIKKLRGVHVIRD
jgi:hypothetical protein